MTVGVNYSLSCEGIIGLFQPSESMSAVKTVDVLALLFPPLIPYVNEKQALNASDVMQALLYARHRKANSACFSSCLKRQDCIVGY